MNVDENDDENGNENFDESVDEGADEGADEGVDEGVDESADGDEPTENCAVSLRVMPRGTHRAASADGVRGWSGRWGEVRQGEVR